MQQQNEDVQHGGGGSPNLALKPGLMDRKKTPTASRGTASENNTTKTGL